MARAHWYARATLHIGAFVHLRRLNTLHPGTCVWTPIPTVVYYDSTNNVNGPTTVVNRCVPVAGDEPAIITFSDGAGRIVSDLNASSMGSLGRLSFPFLYAGNSSAGTVDLAVATLQGTRSLFGSFSVRASELGVTLYLALGPIRPTGPLPAQTSAVNQAEFSQAVVFFEGFQTVAYFPPASQGPGGHFPPGSCRHTVTEGEDLDSIARRYLLNWQARPPRPAPPCRSVSLQLQNPSPCADCLGFQAVGRCDSACHSAATPKCARGRAGAQDLYAYNGHLVRPDDVRPGDVLAVGRHHRVMGPCVNYQTRQSGPLPTNTVVDLRCRRLGSICAPSPSP